MIQLVDHLHRTYPDGRLNGSTGSLPEIAADPDSMRGFLLRIYAEFGSFEDYLDALGIASAVPYLCANLLAT